MTIFTQFVPDSRNGLAVTIRSADADHINEALKDLRDNPKVRVDQKHGYTKRFINGFYQSDLFQDGFGYLKSDDELQYDPESNMLLTVGMAIHGGRSVRQNFDETMARLAEHIYLNYHESKATFASNPNYKHGHTPKEGKTAEYSNLLLTNGFLVAMFVRYCMNSLQLLLRRKIKALIPLLIEKDEEDKVTAVANGQLLDPKKFQRYMEEQISGLLDHLVVK